MDLLKEIFAWTMANYVGVLVNLALLVTALEGIARLTPTESDDSFLERVGKKLRKLMDFLKIPNVKREGLKPSGLHEKRD